VTPEPRQIEDYGDRQIMAARVCWSISPVLAQYHDCLVLWRLGSRSADRRAEEPHVGSIDVDLALDAAKLNDGRYAEILKLLLETKRYAKVKNPSN